LSSNGIIDAYPSVYM